MSIPAPRESDILRACLDLLTLKGIFAWRASNHGVYDPSRKRFRSFHGLKGQADILGCYRGNLLAIEVKKPGGRVSPEQQAFGDRVRRAGGLWTVVYSVAELEAFLEGLEY